MLTCELPRKSVGIAVASQALSMAAEAEVDWKSASMKKFAGPSEPGRGSIGKTNAGLPTKFPWLLCGGRGRRSQQGRAEAVAQVVGGAATVGVAGSVAVEQVVLQRDLVRRSVE